MKKNHLLVVLLAFTCLLGSSQTTEAEKGLKAAVSNDSLDGWKLSGTLFINASQSSFTNWSAGGQPSVSVNGLFNGRAYYKKDKLSWDNTLDIGYGLLKQGKDADFIKTDDKIDFVSKLGYKAFEKWNYAALLNFKTQMDKGYNYPNDSVIISRFLAPAYILGAIGLDYKPGDNMSVFIAPVTSKFTIVNDQTLADSGAFGVDPGNKMRAELGGYIRFSYEKEILKNINFGTKLDLFSNYLNNPGNIDINWETLITLKANEFLSASIATQLIYDDDIKIENDKNDNGTIEAGEYSPLIQFKEVISIGLTLKF